MIKWILPALLLISCAKKKSSTQDVYTSNVILNGLLTDQTINRKFDQLPLKGEADQGLKLWSGDHWPDYRGSINYRWNSRLARGFDLKSPDKETVFTLGPEELALLSPAEKFDLLMGRYEYSLSREIEQKTAPYSPEASGIQQGWAIATINHDRPVSKVVSNNDGLRIPFDKNDIEAILSYYYVHGGGSSARKLGEGCENPPLTIEDKLCDEDLNAGSFHLMLSNLTGISKRSLLVDIDRYAEIWVHPILSYESTLLIESPESIDVKTIVTYLDTSDLSSSAHQTFTRKYKYTLYLDEKGLISGGRWNSRSRPDFLWIPQGAPDFSGQFSGLQKLL